MKSLITALIFLSTYAHAGDAPSLDSSVSMDLDGDGKADLVRIVPRHKEFDRLEVVLSRTRQTITLDSLVKSTERSSEEGSYCSSVTQQILAKGSGRSFSWTEVTSDHDGCAGQLDRKFTIALGKNGLVVTALAVHADSWSMGDPSPMFDLDFNFRTQVVRGNSSDAHSKNEVSKGKVKLSAECAPMPLADFERAPFPACVKEATGKIAKKISLDCGRNADSASCPVSQ
jgi:hypothetical protein